MPIGMQIIGKPFTENYLLSIAAAYQKVTGFAERQPSL